MIYDALISYHRADDALAQSLKSSLERFARPFYRLRTLHVYLDSREMRPGSPMPSPREAIFTSTRHLLLIASPESANSPWIESELQFWLEHHPLDSLVIVLAAGDIAWDPSRNDFDYGRTTALSSSFRGRFSAEPLYVDLRWAKGLDGIADRYQFKDAVATIAAVLRGISKDSILGEDIRQSRRGRRFAVAAVLLLIPFFFLSMLLLVETRRQQELGGLAAREARASQEEALRSREMAEVELNRALSARAELEIARMEADRAQARLAELLQRRSPAGPVATQPSKRLLELQDKLDAAEQAADAAKAEKIQAQDRLASAEATSEQYRQQLDATRSELRALTAGSPTSPLVTRTVQFARENGRALLGFGLVAGLFVFASTRLILLCLQLEFPPVKMVAIPFYLTAFGRWRLYRQYRQSLDQNPDIAFDAQHYIDLPYERGDHVVPTESLTLFLERALANRNVVIQAGGGRGKTTLCHRFILEALRGDMKPNSWFVVPVLLEGLAYEGNLVQSITNALVQNKVYVNSSIVDAQLSAGYLMVMFDGWSEVRDFFSSPNEKSDVPSTVRRLRDTRFVFTSRSTLPSSLLQALGSPEMIRLQDVDESTLRPFLARYLTTRASEVDTLVDTLVAAPLPIPYTPLMLRLVGTVFDRSGRIPSERIELFEQYLGELFRPSAIGDTDLAAIYYIVKILTRSTYLASGGNRGFPVYRGVEILDQARNMLSSFGVRRLPIDLLNLLVQAGLYRRSVDRMRCFHDSFESYFAALALYDEFKEGRTELILTCSSDSRMLEAWEFLIEKVIRENEESALRSALESAKRKLKMMATT